MAGWRSEQQGEAGVLAEQRGDSCVSSAFTLGSFSVGSSLLYERSTFAESCSERRWGAENGVRSNWGFLRTWLRRSVSNKEIMSRTNEIYRVLFYELLTVQA